MSDKISIRCGPADRNGRRTVLATFGEADCKGRFDTGDAQQRGIFRARVIERFGFSEDAHEWLESRLLAEAGTESLGHSQPVLVTMSDVEARSIDWLWPQRIAAGRLSLLVGRPGCGKSFLTCDMASRISTGTPWPDGTDCPRGSAILICAEDDPADTVRPRLDAHRADASRVHMLRAVKRTDDTGRESEVMFSLADIEALESALQRCNDCRLVVVDPSADDTAMGSRAFTGIARSVWHLSRDAEDQGRRLLLPGKSNIAPEQGGLAFSIGGEPAKVHWGKDPVKMTADDALAAANGAGGETSSLNEATAWLTESLDAGPMPAKELKQQAKGDGISLRTLERAKAKLGVVACPDGFGGSWVWKLPEGVAHNDRFLQDGATVRQEPAESAKVSSLADSDETAEKLPVSP